MISLYTLQRFVHFPHWTQPEDLDIVFQKRLPPYYESIAPPSVSTSPQKRQVLLHTPSIKPMRQGLGQNYNTDKITTKITPNICTQTRKWKKHLRPTATHRQQAIKSQKSKHTNNT